MARTPDALCGELALLQPVSSARTAMRVAANRRGIEQSFTDGAKSRRRQNANSDRLARIAELSPVGPFATVPNGMVARLCICGLLAIALDASGLPAAGAENSHSLTSHRGRHNCEAKRTRANKRKCQSKHGIKHPNTTPQPETVSKAVISGLIFATPSAEGLSERQTGPPTSVSDPGVLTVTDANGGAIIETREVTAGSSGFRVVVAAGTYVLSGTDEAFPTASCAPDTITVTEGERLSASIGCTEPSS
jgi:hypothetical protein